MSGGGGRQRRSWRLYTGAMVVAGWSMSAFAQPAALTWQQVREKFQAANPTLRAAQIGIEESKAQEITAYLRPNPDMTTTLDQIQPFNANPYRPLGFTLPLLSGSYLHERGHKRELRQESAQKGTAIAVSQQADLERTLLFTLRGAFVETLQAKAVLALAQENLAYWDRVLALSTDRFRSEGRPGAHPALHAARRVRRDPAGQGRAGPGAGEPGLLGPRAGAQHRSLPGRRHCADRSGPPGVAARAIRNRRPDRAGQRPHGEDPTADAAQRPPAGGAIRRRRPLRFLRTVDAVGGISRHGDGGAAGSESRGAGRGQSADGPQTGGGQRFHRPDVRHGPGPQPADSGLHRFQHDDSAAHLRQEPGGEGADGVGRAAQPAFAGSSRSAGVQRRGFGPRHVEQ